MASVGIDKLQKYYGSVQILHEVDLEIRDGEFVVLVGPSGCGKSTLLRMIAGLEEVSDGSIRIDGRIVNDLPPKQRDLAMVFQSYALYPHMTVAENLGFSLRLAKVDKARMAAEIRRAADILGLAGYLDRYPRHLSGGQRQRVAMGRAIVRNPKVFLFDEPLSNLDAKLRVQMRAEIKALHNRLGATTIYVTHDQTEAMTMADRIVVLRDGHVEQIGSPMDLYRNPRNIFVGGFIGTPPMNFLAAEMRGGRLAFDGGTVALPAGIAAAEGRKVQVGLRPKHLCVADPAAPGAYPFQVAVVEPTGDEIELRGTLFGQPFGVVLPAIAVAPGQTIALTLQSDALFVFDERTGERL